MSDFGDWDENDSLDTEPADPEQVAIKFQRLQNAFDELADKRRRNRKPTWEELDDEDRAFAIQIMAHMLGWLRRQGLAR
jgi:hypothetical protein